MDSITQGRPILRSKVFIFSIRNENKEALICYAYDIFVIMLSVDYMGMLECVIAIGGSHEFERWFI